MHIPVPETGLHVAATHQSKGDSRQRESRAKRTQATGTMIAYPDRGTPQSARPRMGRKAERTATDRSSLESRCSTAKGLR